MIRLLRHLPLLLLVATVLCLVACDGDEPIGNRPGYHDTPGDTTVQPVDTVHPNDTTTPPDTTGGTDTVPQYTLTVNAPCDYGYMGQTIQLTATTNASSTVRWHSSNTLIATVDAQGLVQLANVREDGEVTITATTGNLSDSVLIHNRLWQVAAWTGNTWNITANQTVERGDTLALTIVDSGVRLVNDQGFNAAACQWTASCRTADVGQVISEILPATSSSAWRTRIVIRSDAPANTTFTVMARCGDAAASLPIHLR